MNKIKKSIKRTSAMIATLAIGIITLPTLLSNNESKVNPITTMALAEVGDVVVVSSTPVQQPDEIPLIQNGKKLIDGFENWEGCGLREIKSYCINSGWSCGNGKGLKVEELNQLIRDFQDSTDGNPRKSRTYYRYVKTFQENELRMFEKYVFSYPSQWYDYVMQYAMWALSSTSESILSQYGGSSLSPMQAEAYYRNQNRRRRNNSERNNNYDNLFNNLNNMDLGDLDPNEIFEKYNDLIDNQIPEKEKEITEHKKTIEENTTKINTLNNEIKAYLEKLKELDPNWESRQGADTLKITVKNDNTKSTLEEAEKQVKTLLEEQKKELNEKLKDKIKEIETIEKEILKREASIWELQNTNENITKAKIPNAEEELEKLKDDVKFYEETYAGVDNKVTLESITQLLNNSRINYAKAIKLIDEGKQYEKFYEEIKKQVNKDQIEQLVEDIKEADPIYSNLEAVIKDANVANYIKTNLLITLNNERDNLQAAKDILIEKANGFKVTEPSINLYNSTDVTNVKVVVDQETNEYIAGPFELTYVNGTYGKVTFGGITNMDLVGETNESIPINAFIIDELNDGDLSNDIWINQEDIHYFSPDPDELVDRKEQNYPKAGKPFYVKFSDPQNGKNEVAIKGLRASSECLSDCHGIVSVYEAISYTLEYSESKRTKEVVSVENGEPQYSDETIWYKPSKVTENEEHRQHEATPENSNRRANRTELKVLDNIPKSLEPFNNTLEKIKEGNEQAGTEQNWIDAATNRSKKELDLISKQFVPLTINIGGRVWVDKPVGTTNELDGKRTEGEDENLPGVEVILHNYTLEQQTGQEVIALSYNFEDKNYNYNSLIIDRKIQCKSVTDSQGKYFFTELKPQYKYYVEFKYNGELYEPTYFTDNFEPDYSHSTDTILTRKNFNKKFETIDIYNIYSVKRPLEELGFKEGSTNKVYSLWKYSKSYLGTNDDSMKANHGIKEIYDSLIEKIATHAHDSDVVYQNNAKKLAYQEILKAYEKDPEIKNKLQFIEDCIIDNVYSGYHNGKDYTSDTTNTNKGLYPQYNKFVIGSQIISIGKLKKDDENAISIPPAYPAVLGIDLGLYDRDSGDLNVTKSLYNAEVTVNEKYQIYNYKDRTTMDLDGDGKEDDWELETRATDFGENKNYYNQEFTREIRPADYELDNTEAGYSKDKDSDHFKRDELSKARAEALGVAGNEEQELRVFITYKVKVKNKTSRIAMVPREINDYFDKSFKLSELNYEYKNSNDEPIESNVTCSVDESGEKFNVLTIRDDALIAPGTSKDYLIKFEILKTKDSTNELLNRVILGQKENLVEIMKYSSYYPENYELPDYAEGNQLNKKTVSTIFGEVNPAYGAIDGDSIPGNFNPNSIDINKLRSLKGEEYTKKVKELFEDDSDLAQGLNVTLTSDQRTIKGLAFEDSRKPNDELKIDLGDGVLDDDDTTINGVTVQLVELKSDDSEFIIREYGGKFGSYYNYNINSSETEMNDNLYSKLSGINAKNTTIGQGTGNVETEEPITKLKRPQTDNVNKTVGVELVSSYNLGEDYNKGKFVFYSFPAGDYEVRFIYGNTIRTVLVNKDSKEANSEAKSVSNKVNLSGDNSKSYTGNDYKSTIYQLALNGEDYNKENQHEDYIYNIANSDAYPTMSDAKDVWEKSLYKLENDPNGTRGSRTYVNKYSLDNLTNEKAEILASATSLQRIKRNESNGGDDAEVVKERLDKLMKDTYMRAETGRVDVGIEKYDTNVEQQESNNSCNYIIDHIYLGLTERPKAQIKLEKKIENVILTLSDGVILFDASGTISNVTWKDNDKIKEHYNNNRLAIKYDNKYRNTIELIDEARRKMVGLVNLYMDEELMHGAELKITYRITATNIGEIDFSDKKFYYTGKEDDQQNNIVTTTVNDIFDFVPNNLQFTEGMNGGAWKSADNNLRENYMNEAVKKEEGAYNTVVHMTDYNNIKVPLIPELFEKTNNSTELKSTVEDLLILTSTITPESASETMTYENFMTVVNTGNTVGRRLQYSVAGNGSGLEKYLYDIATTKAETVSVLPPFGQTSKTILIVTSVAGILTIVGIAVYILRRKTAKPIKQTNQINQTKSKNPKSKK